MKDQFQEPGLVTNDLSAGDLAILCFANFIGNALLGQLFLIASHGGDFGNCINAIWKKFGRALRRNSKGMTCREPALFHGSGSKRRESDHISDCIDVWDVCLVMLIRPEKSALICL